MSARPRLRKWLRRLAVFAGVVGLVLALVSVFAVVDGWAAFGANPEGARRQRMAESAQFGEGKFHNPQPLWNDTWGMFTGILNASSFGSPTSALPVVEGEAERFSTPPPTGLRMTWLGHSTIFLEVDGKRILTDPVWGERTSPVTWAGPKRWYAPPIALADLPTPDVVVISHDHYDHLDHPTIVAMRDMPTVFVVPLGVGAHLSYWGIPDDRIVELDWWEKTTVGDLEITCAPARHASGRSIFDADSTLWAGYAFAGPKHKVFFSGDTGLFPAMKDIGEKLGPFDLTLIESGAYGSAWPDWHLGPEQAVVAHQMLQGRVMVPIHWGLFNLAYHGWTEPVERVLVAAEKAGVQVVVPRPGQSIEPGAPPPFERWWPDVPWRTAEQDPIVATKMQ